jgi:hypothetical protein
MKPFRNLLLNPDAAEGSVSAGAAALGAEPSPAAPPAGTPSATPGGAQATPTPTPPVLQQGAVTPASQTMTPEQIATLVAQTVKSVAPAPAAAPVRQYTQEEFNRAFNVYDPTDQDVVDVLAGGVQGKAALARIITGAVKQAVTMAALQHQQGIEDFKTKEFSPRFDPIFNDFAQRQQEKMRDDFFKEHADLKPHQPLVEAIGARLQSEGFQGTKAEAFTAVATQARAILASAGLQPTAAGGQGQPAAHAAPTHQMATLSAPTGGAGGAPATAGTKRPGMAALD